MGEKGQATALPPTSLGTATSVDSAKGSEVPPTYVPPVKGSSEGGSNSGGNSDTGMGTLPSGQGGQVEQSGA